jgi:hypothetical protein
VCINPRTCLPPFALNCIHELLSVTGWAGRIHCHHNIPLLCKNSWVPASTPRIGPRPLRATVDKVGQAVPCQSYVDMGISWELTGIFLTCRRNSALRRTHEPSRHDLERWGLLQ